MLWSDHYAHWWWWQLIIGIESSFYCTLLKQKLHTELPYVLIVIIIIIIIYCSRLMNSFEFFLSILFFLSFILFLITTNLLLLRSHFLLRKLFSIVISKHIWWCWFEFSRFLFRIPSLSPSYLHHWCVFSILLWCSWKFDLILQWLGHSNHKSS